MFSSTNALGSDIAATVNGDIITQDEFVRFLLRWGGYELLQKLINNKLFEQEAERRGIVVTEDEIQRDLYRRKKQYPTEEAYQQYLKTAHTTEEDAREAARINILSQKLVGEGLELDEQVARDYYEENKTRLFKSKTRWHLRELCVETEEEANEILAEIKDGQPFEDLARRRSFLASAKDGGDVGWVEEGERGPQLERSFRRLRVRETSTPTVTPDGVYIFYLMAKEEPRILSFDEVKDVAMEAAERSARIGKYRELIDRLRKDAQIEVLLWPHTQ